MGADRCVPSAANSCRLQEISEGVQLPEDCGLIAGGINVYQPVNRSWEVYAARHPGLPGR